MDMKKVIIAVVIVAVLITVFVKERDYEVL